jgi:hypothetical protein
MQVHRETLEEEATHVTDEARMVLPGVQAVLGFQLIAVFNQRFQELSAGEQLLHLIAFLLMALARHGPGRPHGAGRRPRRPRDGAARRHASPDGRDDASHGRDAEAHVGHDGRASSERDAGEEIAGFRRRGRPQVPRTT